jgi:hypothetical protein
MFPLVDETLTLRLSGKLFNRELPLDDILPFRSNTAKNLYVAEMAVKHSPELLSNNEPTGSPDAIATALGSRLIRETIRFVSGLKKQKIQIEDLYAVGTSKFGIEMCRKLGMLPMDLPTGVREDRVPFHLKADSKAKSLIVRSLAVAS